MEENKVALFNELTAEIAKAGCPQVQAQLAANRILQSPHLRVTLVEPLPEVCEHARQIHRRAGLPFHADGACCLATPVNSKEPK